jgi:fatty-acyl-CoA synthase
VRLAQPDAAARAAQLRDGFAWLELAAAWESPLIRVFGGPPAGTSDEAACAAAVECLAPLADRAGALGVGVALETHDAFSSSVLVRQVLDGVAEPAAGALWDTLHPFRVGEPVDETLGRLAARLLHVHIKDGARPQQGDQWPLTLLGDGVVPVRDALIALHQIGYDGWLSVEWEKHWHPEIAEPEIALPQHAERLRAYLETLQSV